jgi:hypothetical protein
MPTNNCFGLNEDQCSLPSAPDPLQSHPEQSVGSSQPRLLTPPFQNGQLLPQCQVFKD